MVITTTSHSIKTHLNYIKIIQKYSKVTEIIGMDYDTFPSLKEQHKKIITSSHISQQTTQKTPPQFTATVTKNRHKPDIDLLRRLISPIESLVEHNYCDKEIDDQMKHDQKMNNIIHQLHNHRYNNSLKSQPNPIDPKVNVIIRKKTDKS